MIDLVQLDRTVFVWINTSWSSSVFDLIMPWITHLADAPVVWLWILLAGLMTGCKLAHRIKAGQGSSQHRAILRAVCFLCLYMALIYGINAAAYSSLKHLLHRPRPFVQQNAIVRVSPATASHLLDNGSFPSGHACNAFMMAAFFAEGFRRKRYVFYGLASVVALSRVYLGVHYPGDVISGSLLGLTITWLMLSYRPLRKRIPHEDLNLSPD